MSDLGMAIGYSIIKGFVFMLFMALLLMGIGSFITYRIEQIKESHHIVKPEIKLHTDGKTIDTIYVYKF